MRDGCGKDHIGFKSDGVLFRQRQFLNDPARKYDGKEFTVKRKRVIMVGRMPRWYWELYGAESEYGVPYGFCEDDLIRL